MSGDGSPAWMAVDVAARAFLLVISVTDALSSRFDMSSTVHVSRPSVADFSTDLLAIASCLAILFRHRRLPEASTRTWITTAAAGAIVYYMSLLLSLSTLVGGRSEAIRDQLHLITPCAMISFFVLLVTIPGLIVHTALTGMKTTFERS